MKHNIGDTVTVKSDLNKYLGDDNSLEFEDIFGVIEEMVDYAGKTVTIDDIENIEELNDESSRCYVIKEDNHLWGWRDYMFED